MAIRHHCFSSVPPVVFIAVDHNAQQGRLNAMPQTVVMPLKEPLFDVGALLLHSNVKHFLLLGDDPTATTHSHGVTSMGLHAT
jgi:hypothetical protein